MQKMPPRSVRKFDRIESVDIVGIVRCPEVVGSKAKLVVSAGLLYRVDEPPTCLQDTSLVLCCGLQSPDLLKPYRLSANYT